MRKVLLAGVFVAMTLALANPLRAYIVNQLISASGSAVPLKWASTAFPITWQMNPTQGLNVTGSRSQAAVFAASFATWQALNPTTASISFTQGANVPATTQSPAFDKLNV